MLHHNHAADATRRSWPRQRLLKTGRVILHNRMTIDCVIRDLNAEGARLVFDGPACLEPFFQLLVTTTQTVLPVELIWQRGHAADVRFENGATFLAVQS